MYITCIDVALSAFSNNLYSADAWPSRLRHRHTHTGMHNILNLDSKFEHTCLMNLYIT